MDSEVVIFDVEGTLVDSVPRTWHAWRDTHHTPPGAPRFCTAVESEKHRCKKGLQPRTARVREAASTRRRLFRRCKSGDDSQRSILAAIRFPWCSESAPRRQISSGTTLAPRTASAALE